MGKIRVEINGLNLNKFLNEVNNKKIPIFNTQRVEYNELVLECSVVNFKELRSLAIKQNLELKKVSESGIAGLLIQNWFRFGLVAGLLVTIIACNLLTSFYWKVNISVDSNNEIIQAQVNEYLTSQNLKVGAKRQYIATRELEKQILKNIEGCASVVVRNNGVELEVVIKEAVQQSTLSDKDIKASHSGVIEEIKLVSGLLLVNVGESVVTDQPLILADKVGDVFMEANGSIVAKVLVSGEAVGSTETKSEKRTGKVIEVSYINLFGKKLYVQGTTEVDAENSFLRYEVEETEVQLTKNNLVPITKYVKTYYEIEESCDIINYDDLIESLKASAYKTARVNLPQGAEELAVTYNIIENGSIYKVVCNIETRLNIAIRGE